MRCHPVYPQMYYINVQALCKYSQRTLVHGQVQPFCSERSGLLLFSFLFWQKRSRQTAVPPSLHHLIFQRFYNAVPFEFIHGKKHACAYDRKYNGNDKDVHAPIQIKGIQFGIKSPEHHEA